MGTNHRYTATEYKKAMRDMIWRVQDGYEPPFYSSHEELEIFAECIRRGYLYGTITISSKSGKDREFRTLDGKIHPVLYNRVVSPDGLAFLVSEEKEIGGKPDKTHCSEREKRSRKKFYQSGNFWAAAAIFVTIAIWVIDRFVLAV